MPSEYDEAIKNSRASEPEKGLSREPHRIPELKSPFPRPCQPERIQWTEEVANDVNSILRKSRSIERTTDRIEGRYKVTGNELRTSNEKELGYTSRLPKEPQNRNYVAFQFAFSKMGSRFRLASIFSHEFSHGDQVLTRGFTAPEAAPFLGPQEYVLLRWVSEYNAFEFQTTVLKEIVERDPSYAICAERLVKGYNRTDGDPRIHALLNGEPQEARRLIRLDYNQDRLENEYNEHFNVSQAERDRLSDVADLVAKFIVSSEWKRHKAIWA